MDRERARQRLQRGVFVGRDGELQRLHEALQRAVVGPPGLVLLHGEAGIGKTTLAAQLTTLAEAEGWWWCRAQSFEPSLDPYAPWGTVVEAVTRGQDAQALRQRLGRLAPAVARLVPGGLGLGDGLGDDLGDDALPHEALPDDRGQHLDRCKGIATLLCDAARLTPILIVLEDLQAAELPALQVLEYVATHAGTTRLLVVGTYRDHGGADGPRQLGSRLPTGYCDRIGVTGLREDEVRAMLQQIAEQPAPASFTGRLHAASGGNPLLLVMMLWDLLEAGVLVHDGSRWRTVHALEDLTIPDSAVSLLDRRLERLSEETRVVLQLAALYHSDFDLDRLARLDVLPRTELAAGLDAALGTGLIVGTSPPGRFRFRHGVFRHVLHARLGIAARARYHRLIGAALEARPNLADDGVLEAAYHFRQAAEDGDVEPAVRWTMRGAELEWSRGNFDAAAQHYRSALALADGITWCDDAWRLQVLTRRLEALARVGKVGELREATRDALPLARRLGGDHLVAVALAAGGNVRGFGRLRYDTEAVALLEEALTIEHTTPARRALLQARLAEELMMGGGAANARASALMHGALAELPSCDEPHVAAAVLRSLQWAPWELDGPHARLARADEIVALAARARDDELALEGQIARALALLELGAPGRARAALGLVKEAALPRPYYLWALACMESSLAYVEGRLDDVAPLAAEAHRLGIDAEVESAGVFFTAQVGHLLWQRGAFADLDAGLRGLSTTEPQAYAAIESIVRCSLAATWVESGRERDALAYVEEYARDDFRTIAHNALWLPSMAFLGLACRGPDAAPLARRIYDLLAPCAGSHVVLPLMVSYGSVDYFLGVVADTAGDTAAAERHLETALEANRRAGSVQWLARTQVALARRLAAKGDAARATALLDAAAQTSARLELRSVSADVEAVRATLAPAPIVITHAGGVPTYTFRRDEDGFYFFESPAGRGREVPTRALVTAHCLVCRPRVAIDVIDLVHDGKAPATNGEVVDVGSGGERVDAKTLADVRCRLEAVRDELTAARETGNDERLRELAEEALYLEQFLAGTRDRRGRPKKEPDAWSRAYGTAFRRLHRAFDVIAKRCPDMASHLERSVKTGRECVYDPDPKSAPTWILG